MTVNTAIKSALKKLSIALGVLGFGFLGLTFLYGVGGLLVIGAWFLAAFSFVASLPKSGNSEASFSKNGMTYWERDRSRYGDLLEPTDINRLLSRCP